VHKNICVVGDDCQAIYSFRGADLQNILDFENDYPKAKTFVLERNYRSTQQILDAAQNVIEQNPRQKQKKLWTDITDGDIIKLMETQDERDEAVSVVGSIADDVQAKVGEYRDFAILYRTNAQSRAIEEACLESDIPYRMVGGIRFYDRKEIRDVLAYLSLVANPKDIVSFERIVNLPARGLGQSSLERLLGFSANAKIDCIEACRRADEIAGLQASKIQAFQEFGKLMDDIVEAVGRLTLNYFIEYVVSQSRYKDMLLDGSQEGEDRYENIKELKTVAGRYKKLEEFLENVALISDADTYDEKADAVTLMTLHAAKGLEFDHVRIVGVEEGILPHSQSMMSRDELDEERRLCYVGMTRAKQTLHLMYASYRTLYGQHQANGLSRFIEEIPDELIDRNVAASSPVFEIGEGADQEYEEESFENPFAEGDDVFHAHFGKGKVIDTTDDIVSVHFDKGGTRELSVYHAPLKKLEKAGE